MGYFLFLDDLRTVDMVYKNTDKEYILVRSYQEFVNYIQTQGLPAFISFDNDLGEDSNHQLLPDGYACAKWLVYESNLDLSTLKFAVHSSNPVAKAQIESLLTNYIAFLKSKGN